jgi:hypothetical protein
VWYVKYGRKFNCILYGWREFLCNSKNIVHYLKKWLLMEGCAKTMHVYCRTTVFISFVMDKSALEKLVSYFFSFYCILSLHGYFYQHKWELMRLVSYPLVSKIFIQQEESILVSWFVFFFCFRRSQTQFQKKVTRPLMFQLG